MKVLRAVVFAVIASLTLLGGTTAANAEPYGAAAPVPAAAATDPVDPGFPPTD
jgi:hypothetical protein